MVRTACSGADISSQKWLHSLEDALGVRFLKVAGANFHAGNLGSQRQHRHAAAVAVEQAVDEVSIAGPARAGAHGQVAGEVGFGTGRKGPAFFVPHGHKLNALAHPNGIGNAIERVAHYPEYALNARGH